MIRLSIGRYTTKNPLNRGENTSSQFKINCALPEVGERPSAALTRLEWTRAFRLNDFTDFTEILTRVEFEKFCPR